MPGSVWWWNTTDLLSGRNAGHPGRVPAGSPVSSTMTSGSVKAPVVASNFITKSFLRGSAPGPDIALNTTRVPSGENAGVPSS
ncbi:MULTISPECIES: hypothetical protein [Sorangium]|uniref:hypothetical protein n=1 Tax=Sorangium TaxID=39643 RepID=UPI0013EE36A6|nr:MULTISPECIES: hypothetical protein [Sorangium]